MDSGALIVRQKRLLGGALQYPVVRSPGGPGVLCLQAVLEDCEWEIRFDLTGGNDSCVLRRGGDIESTVRIVPEMQYFDGRTFEMPRPDGVRSIPEKVCFDHPFHSMLRCEIKIYDDEPV